MEMWTIWLIAAILFAILEIFTPSFFIIWFGAGSLVTCISSLVTDNVLVQILIFAFSSLLFIVFSRPLTEKLKKDNAYTSNTDALIGKVGIVTKEIKKHDDNGRIEVLGQSWKATSNENLEFNVGDEVKIISITGVTLNVTKIN